MVVVMVGQMDTNLNPNVQDEVKMMRRQKGDTIVLKWKRE